MCVCVSALHKRTNDIRNGKQMIRYKYLNKYMREHMVEKCLEIQ